VLGALTLGNVDDERQERAHPAARVAHRGYVGDHPNGVAIFAHEFLFDHVTCAAVNQKPELPIALFAAVGVRDVVEGQAQQLRLRVAQHVSQASVGRDDATADVGLADADDLLLEQRAKCRVASARQGLNGFPRHWRTSLTRGRVLKTACA
jgi:hypothetical protein